MTYFINFHHVPCSIFACCVSYIDYYTGKHFSKMKKIRQSRFENNAIQFMTFCKRNMPFNRFYVF